MRKKEEPSAKKPRGARTRRDVDVTIFRANEYGPRLVIVPARPKVFQKLLEGDLLMMGGKRYLFARYVPGYGKNGLSMQLMELERLCSVKAR